jgi:hypothetical protein
MKSSIDWYDFYRNRTRNKKAQQAGRKKNKGAKKKRVEKSST